ncbi:hypothetical protein [Rubripirellula reticaptiva]|uniref:Uncharacterized protein n=1 Tax=Rubripirellula reticaptiva TaxID=2528013 RepID=A0A5C6EW46_9BACT|nr:hypothetical protein [Rubripirellula reticaptiva]TWU51451.1 hypothetical protein Poly59_30430 [Rubripirellula reticaptiva]
MTAINTDVLEAVRRFASEQWASLSERASNNAVDSLVRLVLAEHSDFDADRLYTSGPAIRAWTSDDLFTSTANVNVVGSTCVDKRRFYTMYETPLISFFVPDQPTGVLVNCRYGPRWGRGGWFDIATDSMPAILLERDFGGWIK